MKVQSSAFAALFVVGILLTPWPPPPPDIQWLKYAHIAPLPSQLPRTPTQASPSALNMDLVAALSLPNETLMNVEVQGNYAYAGGTGRFYVIDITAPESPRIVGTYTPQYMVCGLAVRQSYAYLSTCQDETYNGGLTVVDVSVPQSPHQVGHYETPGFATQVVLSGNYAYVADGSDVQIIDISTPSNPHSAGVFYFNGFAKGIAVAGNYGYVGDESYGLRIVNISNPQSPWQVSSYPLTGFFNPTRVAYATGRTYVIGSSGMKVINVTNPASPSLEATVSLQGDIRGVSLQGGFAYLTHGPFYPNNMSGVHVYNVQNPTQPTEVGSYQTPVFAWDAATRGPYVFVGTGDFYFGGGSFTVLRFKGLGFYPYPDGYQFRNTGRPLPSWSTFKQTFANSSLEYPFGTPKPVAWLFYEITYRKAFEGVCEGMAATSLAYHKGTEDRPGIVAETYRLLPALAWPLIELYHGRQLSKGLQAYSNSIWNANPSVDSVYSQLKSQLSNPQSDPLILVVRPGKYNSLPQSQRFGHALIPYRFEEQPGDWGRIFVYDPNWPEDTNRHFYFDFQALPHKFDYDMGAPIPANSGANYHVNSANGWVIIPTSLSQFSTFDARVLHDGIFGTLIGEGEVVYTNELGQSLGYIQGVLTSTIPGSAPLYPDVTPDFAGGALGYSLPNGNYHVQISNPGNYEYAATSVSMGLDVRVQMLSGMQNLPTPQLGGSDSMQIGPNSTVSYSSTLHSVRALSLKTASGETGREYKASNMVVLTEATVQAQATAGGFQMQTQGISSTLDLGIRGREGNTTGLFIHRGISLTAGSALTVVAPSLSASSVVTVFVSSPGDQTPRVLVLDNQVRRLFLPSVKN